jgi:GNAT superfamily N-acetyltransferase
MDTEKILALYDRDRREIELYGWRREETPFLVRHLLPDGEGLITYSDLEDSTVEEVIGEQVAHFEEAGCDLTWVVYRHDRPADLKARLLDHGFQAEDPEPTMVLDSEHAPPALLAPPDCDVRRIIDPSRVEHVIAVREPVWPGDYSSTARALARRLVEAPHSLGLYVAYVDGQPAATAQISFYERGRFAGLVGAATLPAYRGRGLYTALLAARVQEARSRGRRFLDADASPMSRPILERHGFRQLTEAHACVWQAPRRPSEGAEG